MNGTVEKTETERILAEIEALSRWRQDMDYFLESGLRDPAVSPQEIANTVAMAMRVLVRLKALHLKLAE